LVFTLKPYLRGNFGFKLCFKPKLKPNALSLYIFMIIRFYTEVWSKTEFKTWFKRKDSHPMSDCLVESALRVALYVVRGRTSGLLKHTRIGPRGCLFTLWLNLAVCVWEQIYVLYSQCKCDKL